MGVQGLKKRRTLKENFDRGENDSQENKQRCF
jgi:hypothetical protein